MVDELLAGRLEVFDVDFETPSFRKELVLTSLVEIEEGLSIVTSTNLVKVTVLGSTTVAVVDAVRLRTTVVARTAVELIVFVETWVVRSVMVLVVVSLEGAIDKHLQALDIAALFMLLNIVGVAHVEEATLLTSSLC